MFIYDLSGKKMIIIFRRAFQDSFRDVPSIDDGDLDNQLVVVDYVEDIYKFYRNIEIRLNVNDCIFSCECKGKIIFFYEKFKDLYVQNMSCIPPDYMRRQFEIKENMREILINWLLEVQICSYTSSI